MNSQRLHDEAVPTSDSQGPSFALAPAGWILRILLTLGLILLSPGASRFVVAQAQASSGSFEAAMERVDRAMTAIEGLRDAIDRSLFDADELAFELAFEDAATITNWVSDNITYLPYRGLLRGADGVLITGAGNSLDQAILLARLLGDAGYSVRVGLAELNEDQARGLLDRAAVPELSSDTEAVLERSEEHLQELAQLPGIDAQAFEESLAGLLQPTQIIPELHGEAQATAEDLVGLLNGNAIQLGDANSHQRLIGEAQEYAWVEYRFSPSEEWTAAHYLMPESFEAPEAQRYLDAEVPQELQHRLRVEVFVESKLGDNLEVSPVMNAWERPVANTWGTVVSYANAPSALGPGEDDMASVLDESEFYIPQWNGSMAPGAQAFDLEGVLLAPSVAGDQAAGVFRQVNRNFQDAVGALGALGSTGDGGGDPQALTGQWIEYTLIAPGGEERTFRRTVFDRIGEEQRSQGGIEPTAMTVEEVQLALVTQQRIMAFPGQPRPEYLVDQFLARLLESRPFLEYTVARLHGVEPSLTAEQALAEASSLEHLLTVRLFDAALPAEPDLLAYRAEPTVLVYSDGLKGSREESTRYSSIDIVHNARRVLRKAGGEFVPEVSAAVQQGVWETIIEREVLSAQGEVWNATSTLESAVAAGANLRVVAPGSDASELGLKAEAAANLQRDLDAGYAAVLPTSFPAGERAAWWRVRPGTGETLGMTADGRGQSMLEYTIQLYDNGISLMLAVKGLNDCEKNHAGDSLAQACCLVKAHVNNVAGMGFGAAFTGALGTALFGRVTKQAAGEITAFGGLLFGLASADAGDAMDVTGLEC